jgi:hypothetical protein
VPAVYLLGTGLLTAAVAWERPVVAAVSLATIAAGVPVAWLWGGFANPRDQTGHRSQKTTRPGVIRTHTKGL